MTGLVPLLPPEEPEHNYWEGVTQGTPGRGLHSTAVCLTNREPAGMEGDFCTCFMAQGRCLKVTGSVTQLLRCRQGACKRNSPSCPGVDALASQPRCGRFPGVRGPMKVRLPCSEGAAVYPNCSRRVRHPYCWCYFHFKSRFKNVRAFQATSVCWCFGKVP